MNSFQLISQMAKQYRLAHPTLPRKQDKSLTFEDARSQMGMDMLTRRIIIEKSGAWTYSERLFFKPKIVTGHKPYSLTHIFIY
jgi:hypothetical protein